MLVSTELNLTYTNAGFRSTRKTQEQQDASVPHRGVCSCLVVTAVCYPSTAPVTPDVAFCSAQDL
eukprot:5422941-Prymnesium_polylepis.1